MKWRREYGRLTDLTGRMPPPRTLTLYFLMRRGVVLYIGATIDARLRVRTHQLCPYKKFDRVMFLPVREGWDGPAERYWIATLCPQHNASDNPHYDCERYPPWGGHEFDRRGKWAVHPYWAEQYRRSLAA